MNCNPHLYKRSSQFICVLFGLLLSPLSLFAQKGFVNSIERSGSSGISRAANSASSSLNRPAISNSGSSNLNRPAISSGSHYSTPNNYTRPSSSAPQSRQYEVPIYTPSRPAARQPSTYYPSTNSAYYSYPAYYRQAYNNQSNSANQTQYTNAVQYHQDVYEKLELSNWLFQSNMIDTLAQLKPITQEYVIENAQDSFTIHTNTGMQLIFKKESLVDGFGNLIKGKVIFHVTEYHSLLDFITGGLSSSTTDGEMLESGGMVDIKAFGKNGRLTLANGKTYQIVSTTPYKDGFQTFYGKTGDQVSWSTDNRVSIKTNPETKKKFTLTIAPVISYDSFNKGELIVAQSYQTQALSLGDWFTENIYFSKEFKKSLQGEGMHFPAKLKLDAFGRITDVFLTNKEQKENGILKQEWENIRELLLQSPKLLFTNGHKLDSQLMVEFMVVASNYKSTKIMPPMLPSPVANQMAQKNSAGNWVLESSSLSLVNCDRFSNMVKSKDTIFTSIKHGTSLTYFVFFDYNAMLMPNVKQITETGYNFGLRQFPENAHSRVVSIVYEDNGKTHLEVSENNGTSKLSEPVIMPFNQLLLKACFNRNIPINQIFNNK